MDASLFSGFNIECKMDAPVVSPIKSRSAFNSPVLKAKVPTPKLDEDFEVLSGAGGEAAEEEFVEPILRENPNRFTLFPIVKPKLFKLYKHHLSVFWVAEEVPFEKDRKDWEKLTDNERHFIKHVLAFFANADSIVQENLAIRFMKEVQLPEVRNYYSVQLMAESIHNEVYSLLIDTYIDDKEEKHKLFNAMHTIPCIKLKTDWAQRWIESKDENFATRLVAFAVVESIQFSSAFCSIYWIKERGLLPALTTSNELISRDEGLHVQFAVALYEELERKLSKAKVHKIIREAVEIEREFITDAIPCSMIGMNCDLMFQYIKFCADRLSTQLGYGKIYSVSNPFDFMERISLEGKDNFFEKRVTNYAKAGVGKTREEMSFSLDTDF